MVTPADTAKPDLGSLRIRDGQRAQSSLGRRMVYAAIPVVIFAGIVVAERAA